MPKLTVRKSIPIKASREKVWHVLFAPETFSQWSVAFCPDLKMEGNWEIGEMITYSDNEGMGIKAKVMELKSPSLAAVEYVDLLEDRGVDQEGWIGCREIYKLSESEGKTTLSVESEVPTQQLYDEFEKAWGKALTNIQGLSEQFSQE